MLAALELRPRRLGGQSARRRGAGRARINPNELFRSGTQFSFLAVAVLVRQRPLARYGAGTLDPLEQLIADTRPWPMRVPGAAWPSRSSR